MRHGSPPVETRTRRQGMRAGAALALALVVGMGCRAAPTAWRPAPAPAAEFLLTAGDSTFWVTTGPQGVRVRGSPLVLARFGGRFYEVYVADEDHSYYDAVFTSQRIYRRDLLTGDSMAVFRDTTVAHAARGYAVAHPGETPLPPDEDASENPSTSVTGEVDIVDVAGPYLSFEYRGSAVARRGDADTADGRPEQETVRRGVVDLRGGGRASLAAMFGAPAARATIADGRRALAATMDSIRAARAAGDERARRAAAALREFSFDSLSFTLMDVGREPAVQFFAPGRGAQGGGLALPIPPLHVRGGERAPWWRAEQAALPLAGADSASDIWARPDLEVVARYDTAGGTREGAPGAGYGAGHAAPSGGADDGGIVLLLRAGRADRPDSAARGARAGRERGAGGALAGRSRDGGIHEWRLGRFPGPARRLYWLDGGALDTAERRALVRAFDESALYGDDARTVRAPLPAARGARPRVTLAALGTPLRRSGRPRPQTPPRRASGSRRAGGRHEASMRPA